MKGYHKTTQVNNIDTIGQYKIGDGNHFISFALTKKPNWFHRLMVRFFFGVRWIDSTPTKPSKGISVGGVSNGEVSKKFRS